MPATVVMVWREIVSHVEGVVGRQRRVWTSARPLAPSPAVAALLSERCNGLGSDGAASSCSHALTPPVE